MLLQPRAYSICLIKFISFGCGRFYKMSQQPTFKGYTLNIEQSVQKNRWKDIARNCDHIFFSPLHSTDERHLRSHLLEKITRKWEFLSDVFLRFCVKQICRLLWKEMQWTVGRSVHWIIYLAIVIEFRWTNFVIFSIYWIYSGAWIELEVQMQTINSMGIKSSMKSTASRPQSFIWSNDFNKFINQLRQTHRQWENIKC